MEKCWLLQIKIIMKSVQRATKALDSWAKAETNKQSWQFGTMSNEAIDRCAKNKQSLHSIFAFIHFSRIFQCQYNII